MNFGFNSNVQVGSAMYHVQTEDRGPSHPYLDTVVYLAGRVIYKRSASYEQFASETIAEALPEKLRERIAQQHREVIAELEAGTLALSPDGKTPAPAAESDSHDGLEVRLSNPGSWLAAGNVILEIELRDKNAKRQAGEADVQAFLEIGKQRIPCAEARAGADGRAMLKFPFPPNASDGSSLVVRATGGTRYGELRFRLKAKPREKSPAPVSR